MDLPLIRGLLHGLIIGIPPLGQELIGFLFLRNGKLRLCLDRQVFVFVFSFRFFGF